MAKKQVSRQPDKKEPAEDKKPARQQPKETPDDYEPIELTSHKQLLTEQNELFRRFNSSPELSTLLFINPVLAFQEVGVTMSPEIAHHVLHTIQHPPHMRRQRDALEASLKEALGEVPQPNNREWLAATLFEKLDVPPLQTSGYRPEYKSQLNDEVVEKLQAMRPKKRKRPLTKTRGGGMRLRVRTTRPAIRRMDLDAPLPELKRAEQPPKSMSLETLYFYKDSHPVARELLELGIIQQRSFPIHSGDSYRKVKSGERRSAFRSWIRAVRFPEDGES